MFDIYFRINTHPEKPVIPSLMFPPTFLEFKFTLITINYSLCYLPTYIYERGIDIPLDVK